ncbi:hypothetical protein FJ492_13175 [Mesorhizobium sp. B2-5-4]|uniref:hypothetical protein n=1 Tax=unclassified Mesorhizobium TaxID=325217 RepID=UPI0011273619|nr:MULTISPECIES: hypothetical protein [unclassified Mesorhizobium]TPJ44228.1 hypothetical protein FJ432_04260 [Mesorhizobium sp. B2-6-5]TPJ90768.1 hypothetical protein FJ434_07190 [Mesorhizobium sp. B2-5-13]TPK44356.1 hypothetical protein FJ492_13175 [Mesorhizobium sp. B2-5-4]TPK54599.1 hypothetical protein FJ560_01285 [Mesorhizobium sp. B2-5-5]
MTALFVGARRLPSKETGFTFRGHVPVAALAIAAIICDAFSTRTKLVDQASMHSAAGGQLP